MGALSKGLSSIMEGLETLEKAIGYTFRDKSLLHLALTHPSAAHIHNQRMEFLGDAVLELCVSEKIYEMHPELQEGGMTQLRQKLVREERLAKVAKDTFMGEYLIVGHGFDSSDTKNKPSVLCDTFEAVLAAVYLDGGMDAAKAMVLRLIGDCSESCENDAKSALQEYLQGQGRPTPKYEEVSVSGPAHNRLFTMAVVLDGVQLATGDGTRKQKAEQEAARKALQILMGERQQ